jgi:hypothetical protein
MRHSRLDMMSGLPVLPGIARDSCQSTGVVAGHEACKQSTNNVPTNIKHVKVDSRHFVKLRYHVPWRRGFG